LKLISDPPKASAQKFEPVTVSVKLDGVPEVRWVGLNELIEGGDWAKAGARNAHKNPVTA
jgi:hypothetical protein